MSSVKVICTECPMGCEIEVLVNGDEISVEGYGCKRGREYAEAEVVCPRRVVTSTVRSSTGRMVPVKTERPVKRSEIFAVMEKINAAGCSLPVRIGDVIVRCVSEDINVIATANVD
ncbi:MAG: DUF1667 domain-containing protein [Clostridia bacterium]|nr:DUF1667 domain-containing protein [Clostridia bacterium]